MTEQSDAAVDALSDQIKATCQASGLQVLGFTVLVVSGEGLITVNSNARIEHDQYMAALKTYIESEEDDPTPFG